MTRKIEKAVIEVTVLREVDEGGRYVPIDHYRLEEIGYEIDEGDWLGSTRVVSVEEVHPDNVNAQAQALGNDGSFFDDGEQS